MAGHASEVGLVVMVIPAYRAVATIGDVVGATRRVMGEAPIVVVDDGSGDGTGAAAAAAGAVVVAHAGNRGKGAALETGTAFALAAGATVVVTLDADGQHPPAEIPRLAAPVVSGAADLVLGARARTPAMPLARRCTNWLSAGLASRVAGAGVSDAQTGFRAFTRALATAVRPAERRYDYEAAFLLAALAAGFRVRSVGIPTVYAGAASHFRYWEDTWRLAQVYWRHGGAILRGAPR